MKILPSLILSLSLIGIWSCSDAGDPISNSEGECVATGDNLDENGEDCTGTCGGISIIINETCTNISYALTIQPIFDNNCISCHNEGHSTGLDLSTHTGVMAGGENGLVISLSHSESLLWQRVDLDEMPPGTADSLREEEKDFIGQWIDEGAPEN